MARYFDEHQKRDVRELGGAWRFMTDPKKVGEEEGWNKALPTKDTVTVPSMWNNEMGLLGYEGAAWYEKTFYTRGGCLRLHFGAVMTKADVWFDGEYLGSHYGGFCAFSFIVRDVTEGEHVGYVAILWNGKTLGTVPLYTAGTAERSSFVSSLKSIQSLTQSRVFRAAAIFFAVSLAAWITVECILVRYRRHKWDKYFSMKMAPTPDAFKKKK